MSIDERKNHKKRRESVKKSMNLVAVQQETDVFKKRRREKELV